MKEKLRANKIWTGVLPAAVQRLHHSTGPAGQLTTAAVENIPNPKLANYSTFHTWENSFLYHVRIVE